MDSQNRENKEININQLAYNDAIHDTVSQKEAADIDTSTGETNQNVEETTLEFEKHIQLFLSEVKKQDSKAVGALIYFKEDDTLNQMDMTKEKIVISKTSKNQKFVKEFDIQLNKVLVNNQETDKQGFSDFFKNFEHIIKKLNNDEAQVVSLVKEAG